jgi:hypothetical protein
MEEEKIKSYFERQVRRVFESSEAEPDGFRDYFQDHEPKDEEILGLLAIFTSMGGEFEEGPWFPTPLEALAALSPSSRAAVCQEFRAELKTSRRHLIPT